LIFALTTLKPLAIAQRLRIPCEVRIDQGTACVQCYPRILWSQAPALPRISLRTLSRYREKTAPHAFLRETPSAGKTTVTRVLEKSSMRKASRKTVAFFEYSRRDFCGHYIDKTALKTAAHVPQYLRINSLYQ
jgi:hypothetical protein